MTGRHAIVTGCARGSLGYDTAKALARWGAAVVVTTRRSSSLTAEALREDLRAEGIEAIVDGHDLDLSAAASVAAFAKWYEQHQGRRLDVLVNNGGIHLDLMSQWTEPRLTEDGYELHWRTNYLGTAHLTHTLLSLLKETGAETGDARIVNVVSQLHTKGSNAALFDPAAPYDSWRSYGLSKLALVHFTYEAQRRFAESCHVQSYCLHPGGVSGARTNIADKGLEGSRLVGWVRRVGAPLESLFMATAEEGAQTQIHCATAPGAEGGRYYLHCRVGDAAADAEDEAVAERLWQETAEWVGTLDNRGEHS